MGKVKEFDVSVFNKENIEYQFPMGKVKKGRTKQKLVRLQTYQFPMGKVKPGIIVMVPYATHVSIPNGKGKGGFNAVSGILDFFVSIPNGKGKVTQENTSPCLKMTVSIPNGKGKVEEVIL